MKTLSSAIYIFRKKVRINLALQRPNLQLASPTKNIYGISDGCGSPDIGYRSKVEKIEDEYIMILLKPEVNDHIWLVKTNFNTTFQCMFKVSCFIQLYII